MDGIDKMTKKDYELIAEVLGKKFADVKTWQAESASLGLAYIEDFLHMLEANYKNFDRSKFLARVNHYTALNER